VFYLPFSIPGKREKEVGKKTIENGGGDRIFIEWSFFLTTVAVLPQLRS